MRTRWFRPILLAALLAGQLSASAQSQSDAQWRELIHMAQHGSKVDLRIETSGEPINCDLREVTDTGLTCVEHIYLPRSSSPAFPGAPFTPPRIYDLDRSFIRSIRAGSREGRPQSADLPVSVWV